MLIEHFSETSIFYIKTKMKFKIILLIILSVGSLMNAKAEDIRESRLLNKNWKFSKGDFPNASLKEFDDTKWKKISIPHDWAIFGPFDRNYDLQTVTVTQNLEKDSSEKTGRTGGLPYVGVGWYRTIFSIDDNNLKSKNVALQFDGAMSEAEVYVNGHKVCSWPYGYNAFHCDITDFLTNNGKGNLLAVRLENKPESSRWYPGAGLYRNVHLIITDTVHVPIWGTYVYTPYVSVDSATVKLEIKVENAQNGELRIVTEIRDKDGNVITENETVQKINNGHVFEQNFVIDKPHLWSPENPNLYFAVNKVYYKHRLVDEYKTRFGIREVKFIADKGFFLNNKPRKFQGVCLHHDLGPLGTAINKAALRRQLTLLKDMGCDAIRTAHNMPAPELVELCDEMGFMLVVESFDEWDVAKCKNGYHRYFAEWTEKDMINMIHHFRNNPSVILWSIGNEVPTQCVERGSEVAEFLQDICHREDPTRLVTCGMDQVDCVLNNGFAALLDVPGLNYRTHKYAEAYEKLSQNFILGSETSSTVSSRGIYKFPVQKKAGAMYDDHQSSSYDVESCSWSNLPDEDFALADDHNWTLGQFVWTGFDYLGEPSPYDTDAWPSHSSMFGIIDLASIPKDRYWLYRSIWNKDKQTLHVLPHWSWPGREGEVTPIFVYTSYPSAELFVNGISQGVHHKSNESLQQRYRLMWNDVIYSPGEIKVIAYNKEGKACEGKVIRTAGEPHHLELISDRNKISADGEDLVYVNVRAVDKDGNLCPHDNRLVSFEVKGNGIFKATANGDPTCLDPFQLPQMHLFNGELTVIIQSKTQKELIQLEAKSENINSGKLKITTF